LARRPLHVGGGEVVARELLLQQAVDAAHLLLLAEAESVLAELDATLPVLTRGIRTTADGALLREAALSLQVQLRAFAATELADGTKVTCHDSLSLSALHAAALGSAATVVGNGGHVADDGDAETNLLQGTQSALTTRTRTVHEHRHGAHPVLHRPTPGLLRGELRREGRALARALEPTRAGAGRRHRVTVHVGDRDDGVVEGRTNVRDPRVNVLLRGLANCALLSCSHLESSSVRQAVGASGVWASVSAPYLRRGAPLLGPLRVRALV